VWHDSFICVTWLIHMCGMTHSYVWHDSFTCVTWLIHMCDMTHSYATSGNCGSTCLPTERGDGGGSFLHTCVMTNSHVWHDYSHVTWLIHMCDMTRSYVWRDSFTCVTWHIHIRQTEVAVRLESPVWWFHVSHCNPPTPYLPLIYNEKRGFLGNVTLPRNTRLGR